MDALDRWALDLMADGYSPRTVEARRTAVMVFSRASGVAPEGLAREHVLAYLSGRPLAVRTRRAYLSHLRAWSAWLGDEDLTAGIRRPPTPRGVPRPVTEAQLARLLIAARPGHRERAFLVLGAYAGCRAFETARVAAEDLEEVDAGWALRIVGKGGQMGLVPVPDVVVDVLAPWRREVRRGRLWPRASGDSVRNTLRQLGERAGVAFTSHQLRHRYGTAFYAESKDLLLTQQVMRHASPATTAGYALVVADQAAAVVARLPGAARAVGGMQ